VIFASRSKGLLVTAVYRNYNGIGRPISTKGQPQILRAVQFAQDSRDASQQNASQQSARGEISPFPQRAVEG
jgi:hypothetical protein